MVTFRYCTQRTRVLVWALFALSHLSDVRNAALAQASRGAEVSSCGGRTLPVLQDNAYYLNWQDSAVVVQCAPGYALPSGDVRAVLRCAARDGWSLAPDRLLCSPRCPDTGACGGVSDYCDPLFYPDYNITFGEVNGCPEGYTLRPGPRTLSCVDNAWLPELFCDPVCECGEAGDCVAPGVCLCPDMQLRSSCNTSTPDQAECSAVHTLATRFENGSVAFECPAATRLQRPLQAPSVELECAADDAWVVKNTSVAESELVCQPACPFDCSGVGSCNGSSQCVCPRTHYGAACEAPRCTSQIPSIRNAHFQLNAAHSVAVVECSPGYRWPPGVTSASPGNSRSVITVLCADGVWAAPPDVLEGCILDTDPPCGEVVAPPFVEVLWRSDTNLTLACKNKIPSVMLEAACEQDSWVTADTREKLRALTLAAWQRRCQVNENCSATPPVAQNMTFTALPQRSANLGSNVSAGYVGCMEGFAMPRNTTQALVICSPDTHHKWLLYDDWRQMLESNIGPLPNLNQTQEVVGLPVCLPACSPPCQNGGTCTADGECLCTPSFKGIDCSEPCDVAGKLCLQPPPIIQNADIYYNGSVAVVECHAGYELLTGLTHYHIYCDFDTWLPANTHGGIDKQVLPSCDPVCQLPCLNGGTCVGPNKCDCPTQYRGSNCQVPKQPECPTDPDALPNGFIRISESGRSLTCAEGYELRGGLAEAVIWCHGGKWTYPRALYSGPNSDQRSSSAVTEEQHHLQSLSLSGLSEPQFSPCLPVCDPPCRNRGVCVSPDTCECPQPFEGDTCEQRAADLCWGPPPTIGNASIMFSPEKASLMCEDGYELASGERAVDLICRSSTWTPDPESDTDLNDKCIPKCHSPCLNGGVCVAPDTCECPPEFQGPTCAEAKPLPCPAPLQARPNTRLDYRKDESVMNMSCHEGYGLQDGVPGALLKCDNGTWTGVVGGVAFTSDELRCVPVCEGECLNGGQCTAPGVCQCTGDYTGPSCSVKRCVPPQTLRNNTIFYYDSTEGILDVQCKEGFRLPSGNISAALLCRNGKWISPSGENTVFCLPSCYPPCLNGGRCVGPSQCSCPEGFTGPTCSKRYSLSVQGTRCVFPFYYRGRMHHNCVRRSVEEVEAAPRTSDRTSDRLLVDGGLLDDGAQPRLERNTSSERGGPWCPTTVDTFRRPLQWETCAGVVGPYAAMVTKNGEACVFPFRYDDEEYYSCTTAGGRPAWCATEVADDGTALRWDSCDIDYGLKSVTLTFQGAPCRFPFRYEGQWYDECISELGSAGAWCASDLSPAGDLLQRADCILDWGHYQDYLTKAQKVCASPYAVDDTWHTGCQGEKPWCAVKVDQDRQVVKWARCDNPRDWPGVSVSLPMVPILTEVSVFSVTGERCLDVAAGAAKRGLKGCLVDGSLKGAPWCPLEMDGAGSVTKKGVCLPDWYLSFAPPWQRKYIDAGPKEPVSRQTVDGQACILPFKNNGKVYFNCVPHVPPTSEHDSWCAVAVTQEMEVKRWKNCKPAHGDHEGPLVVAVTNNIVTKQQRLCVLPFKFDGSVYFSCIRPNGTAALPGDNGWCATAVDEAGVATERGDCPVISDRIDETILQMAEECDDDESSSLPFSLLPESDAERWSAGDGSETRCVVPYVFENQTYWDCTRAGTTGDEEAWCAVEIDQFRNVVKKQKCSTGWQLKGSGDIKPVAWEQNWLLDMRNTILGSGDLMSPKERQFERYDTITGKECIFPFKTRNTNVVHTSCICSATDCQGDHRSICATEVDEFGYMTAHEPCRGVLIRKNNFFDQLIST